MGDLLGFIGRLGRMDDLMVVSLFLAYNRLLMAD